MKIKVLFVINSTTKAILKYLWLKEKTIKSSSGYDNSYNTYSHILHAKYQL